MIELYALTDDPAPPPSPLRAVRFDGLTALVAPAAETEEEVTPDVLWRHEEVVEALMEERDVLPVRFGTRLPDERELGLALAGRCEELRAALERVRGAVELAVRAVGSDDDGLHDTLGAMARASVVLEGPELLRAAYLVDREEVGAFVQQVRALQRPGLDILCTGPWPPYSFT
jgi:hypothetical protein